MGKPNGTGGTPSGNLILSGELFGAVTANLTFDNSTITSPIVTNAALAGASILNLTVTAAGVAYTLNSPFEGLRAKNALTGSQLVVRVVNNAGAALGVMTWSSIFSLAGAWVQPASGLSRLILFQYSGAKLMEIGRTAVDVS